MGDDRPLAKAPEAGKLDPDKQSLSDLFKETPPEKIGSRKAELVSKGSIDKSSAQLEDLLAAQNRTNSILTALAKFFINTFQMAIYFIFIVSISIRNNWTGSLWVNWFVLLGFAYWAVSIAKREIDI